MTHPKAHLEITSGVLRVFNSGTYGDPFDYACTVAGDEGVATIKGLKADGGFTTGHRKAIFAVLREAGFREVVWHRIGAAGRRTVRTRLAPA